MMVEEGRWVYEIIHEYKKIIREFDYWKTMELLCSCVGFKPWLVVRELHDGRRVCFIQVHMRTGDPKSFRCMGTFLATPGRLSFAEGILGQSAEIGYRVRS